MDTLHISIFNNINHHKRGYASFDPKEKLCSLISNILINSHTSQNKEYINVIMACKNDIKELIKLTKINYQYNGCVERELRHKFEHKCMPDIHKKIPYNFDDYVIKYDIDDIKKNINFDGEIKVYDINEIDKHDDLIKYNIEYNKNMNQNVVANLSNTNELDSVD